MIKSIKELSGSTRNENGTVKLPALIQLKSGIINVFAGDELSSKNSAKLNPKDSNTIRLPIKPATLLGSTLRPNPLIMNPSSGNKGIK